MERRSSKKNHERSSNESPPEKRKLRSGDRSGKSDGAQTDRPPPNDHKRGSSLQDKHEEPGNNTRVFRSQRDSNSTLTQPAATETSHEKKRKLKGNVLKNYDKELQSPKKKRTKAGVETDETEQVCSEKQSTPADAGNIQVNLAIIKQEPDDVEYQLYAGSSSAIGRGSHREDYSKELKEGVEAPTTKQLDQASDAIKNRRIPSFKTPKTTRKSASEKEGADNDKYLSVASEPDISEQTQTTIVGELEVVVKKEIIEETIQNDSKRPRRALRQRNSKPNYKEIDSDEERRLAARMELKRKVREENGESNDEDDEYVGSSESSDDSDSSYEEPEKNPKISQTGRTGGTVFPRIQSSDMNKDVKKEAAAATQFERATKKNREKYENQVKAGEILSTEEKQKRREAYNAMNEDEKKLHQEKLRAIQRQRLKYKRKQMLSMELKMLQSQKCLVTSLSTSKPDIQKCLEILGDMKTIIYSPICLLKNPYVVECIRKMRHYKPDAHIRQSALEVYKQFECMFGIPDKTTFNQIFKREVAKFELNSKDWVQKRSELTEDSKQKILTTKKLTSNIKKENVGAETSVSRKTESDPVNSEENPVDCPVVEGNKDSDDLIVDNRTEDSGPCQCVMCFDLTVKKEEIAKDLSNSDPENAASLMIEQEGSQMNSEEPEKDRTGSAKVPVQNDMPVTDVLTAGNVSSVGEGKDKSDAKIAGDTEVITSAIELQVREGVDVSKIDATKTNDPNNEEKETKESLSEEKFDVGNISSADEQLGEKQEVFEETEVDQTVTKKETNVPDVQEKSDDITDQGKDVHIAPTKGTHTCITTDAEVHQESVPTKGTYITTDAEVHQESVPTKGTYITTESEVHQEFVPTLGTYITTEAEIQQEFVSTKGTYITTESDVHQEFVPTKGTYITTEAEIHQEFTHAKTHITTQVEVHQDFLSTKGTYITTEAEIHQEFVPTKGTQFTTQVEVHREFEVSDEDKKSQSKDGQDFTEEAEAQQNTNVPDTLYVTCKEDISASKSQDIVNGKTAKIQASNISVAEAAVPREPMVPGLGEEENQDHTAKPSSFKVTQRNISLRERKNTKICGEKDSLLGVSEQIQSRNDIVQPVISETESGVEMGATIVTESVANKQIIEFSLNTAVVKQELVSDVEEKAWNSESEQNKTLKLRSIVRGKDGKRKSTRQTMRRDGVTEKKIQVSEKYEQRNVVVKKEIVEAVVQGTEGKSSVYQNDAAFEAGSTIRPRRTRNQMKSPEGGTELKPQKIQKKITSKQTQKGLVPTVLPTKRNLRSQSILIEKSEDSIKKVCLSSPKVCEEKSENNTQRRKLRSRKSPLEVGTIKQESSSVIERENAHDKCQSNESEMKGFVTSRRPRTLRSAENDVVPFADKTTLQLPVLESVTTESNIMIEQGKVNHENQIPQVHTLRARREPGPSNSSLNNAKKGVVSREKSKIKVVSKKIKNEIQSATDVIDRTSRPIQPQVANDPDQKGKNNKLDETRNIKSNNSSVSRATRSTTKEFNTDAPVKAPKKQVELTQQTNGGRTDRESRRLTRSQRADQTLDNLVPCSNNNHTQKREESSSAEVLVSKREGILKSTCEGKDVLNESADVSKNVKPDVPDDIGRNRAQNMECETAMENFDSVNLPVDERVSGRRMSTYRNDDTFSEPYSPVHRVNLKMTKSKSLPSSPYVPIDSHRRTRSKASTSTCGNTAQVRMENTDDLAVPDSQNSSYVSRKAENQVKTNQEPKLACIRTKSRKKKRSLLSQHHGVRSVPNSPVFVSHDSRRSRSLPGSPLESDENVMLNIQQAKINDIPEAERESTHEPSQSPQKQDDVAGLRSPVLNNPMKSRQSFSDSEIHFGSPGESSDGSSIKRKVLRGKRKTKRRSAVHSEPSSPSVVLTKPKPGTSDGYSPSGYMKSMFLRLGDAWNKMFQSSPK